MPPGHADTARRQYDVRRMMAAPAPVTFENQEPPDGTVLNDEVMGERAPEDIDGRRPARPFDERAHDHPTGCVAARICNTNNCPAGIATQQEHLRARLNIDKSSQQLARFLKASVELMQVMARACGHSHLSQFNADDITTWKKEMSDLAGIQFAGIA